MLHHVQEMSISCSPAKNELHDDERKPISLVPKPEEANQPDADGSEAQLHLESAVQGPADAGGDLVRIEDVTEQSAHDAKPA